MFMRRFSQCQWRRPDISTRALRTGGGCPWSSTTMVFVNWLYSTASSSDLYRSAKFRVQRTCGVEQFATRLVREYVTVYVQDETEDASAQTIMMTTKTTRHCCGVFSWFRRRDINDYTYLLTYLLRLDASKYVFRNSAVEWLITGMHSRYIVLLVIVLTHSETFQILNCIGTGNEVI